MSDHTAATSVVRNGARGPISWTTATLVALLMPVLLFWTPSVMASALGDDVWVHDGLAMSIAIAFWSMTGIALALSSTPNSRGWGLGLLAGVAACVPWAFQMFGGPW